MADRLIVLLGLAPDAPIRWGRFADARLIEGGRLDNAEALATLAARAAAAETVVALLPGEQVAARRVDSWPKDAGKARAAAVYLMEDELAEAGEALHVAVAATAGAGLALAVKAAIVETWLAAFDRAGVDCAILSTDYLALSSSSDAATILFEEGRVVAAIDGAGLAIEADLFAVLAPDVFKAAARITAIGDPALQRLLPATSAVDWAGPADEARVLTLYGASLAEKAPPTLLQGAYQKRRALRPLIAPWRRAGLIAAAAAGVFCLSLGAQAWRAEADARAWRAQARAVHGDRFPDAAAADPVAHARRLLAQSGGDNAFLALAAHVAEALKDNKGVEIERLRFNAARGEFIVSITSASDAGIETLKTRLAARGVEAQDNGGYRRSGGAWTGELAVRLP